MNFFKGLNSGNDLDVLIFMNLCVQKTTRKRKKRKLFLHRMNSYERVRYIFIAQYIVYFQTQPI